jgi:hypothetical protein
MLSISRNIVERDVSLSALFDELKISGENIEVSANFDIQILSYDASTKNDCFKQVEGFRKTEHLPIWRLTVMHEMLGAMSLECAFKHNVLTTVGWKYAQNVIKGDLIVVRGGYTAVVVESNETVIENESLFDLQVADTHCFYTNDILSHNSHFLVQLGANAVKSGRNVLHYTFELSEKKVGIRYDSNLSNVSATDVPDEKEFIRTHYESNKSNWGRLIIKEYPTSTATIMMLKAHIEKLAITKSFRPDVIIIDYADIMRSSRQFDSLRHELKLVYEELRTLAMELNVPIWTASQVNRDGSDTDVVGLDKISESYGKAMICDFIISLSRKPIQKAKGLCNIFIPKSRLGKDGIIFPGKIDTSRSIIEVLDANVDLEDFQMSADTGMKQLLKDKWEQVSADRMVSLRSINKVANGSSSGEDE